MEISDLPRPKRSYLVCATPRSGSTLLCKALEVTGCAGHPEEFFEAKRETGSPARGSDYLWDAPRWTCTRCWATTRSRRRPTTRRSTASRDYREHLAPHARAGTTPNGVFGAKIMWGHREDFLPLARSLPGAGRPARARAARGAVPEPELRVGAARGHGAPGGVALEGDPDAVVALRPGGRPSARAGLPLRGAPPPAADARAQRHGTGGAGSRSAGCSRSSSATSASRATRRAPVEDVLGYVGIDAAGHPQPDAPMKPQADAVSDDWVARYFRERRRTGLTGKPNILYLHSHDTGRYVQPYGHGRPHAEHPAAGRPGRAVPRGVLRRADLLGQPRVLRHGPVPALERDDRPGAPRLVSCTTTASTSSTRCARPATTRS